MLDLTLFNGVDSPYTVEMGLFRVDGDLSQSDARAHSESIDVDPEGEARREDIVGIRQYLIRYEVYEDNSRRTDKDHVHYYPPGDGDDGTVTFDIHPPGVMNRRHG